MELIRTESSSYITIKIKDGKVEETSVGVEEGCGIRLLVDGILGFAYGPIGQESTIRQMAQKTIEASRKFVKEKTNFPADIPSYQDEETIVGKKPLADFSFEDKMNLTLECNKNMKGDLIKGKTTLYKEIIRRVTTETSWGTKIVSTRPYVFLRTMATAKQEKTAEGRAMTGHIGGMEIFDITPIETLAEKACDNAIKGVQAKSVKPGKYPIVVNGELNHIFAHEAAGHPAEGDLVRVAGVLRGKLGKRIAAPNLNLIDDATLEKVCGIRTFGNYMYDDEGTKAQRTMIIKDGILKTYLTDLETAAYFNIKPSGNCRAELFSSIPVVRMSNTFIEANKDPYTQEELLQTVKKGYFMKGASGGQVDPIRGTFNFGCGEVYEIINGELGKRFAPTTIAGNTLVTLKTISGVSNDLESPEKSIGYCGKNGQNAPVGTSGGWMAIKSMLIGG